ncbi:MAG: DUF1848 family protein [Candidatus Odinarchaeota archaeon]|nr:DUF1848 family protein [Candidatus Odinarchaeota archaeon]
MNLITWFDPWKSELCTCPKKYSLNPYTGCDHFCKYCYITSYIPNGFAVREKKNYFQRLKRELLHIDFTFPIAMSNSSDPYPRVEKEKKITRKTLEIMKRFPVKLIITTKSDIIVRDIDLLKEMQVAVMFTITTMNPVIASKLEPFAPSPKQRIDAARRLIDAGIPVGVRVDPIILGINDNYESISAVVKECARIGCVHIVSSTYKPRADNWKRMMTTFPEIMKKTKRFYSEKVGYTTYMQKNIRLELMKTVRDLALKYGLTFATCREGFVELHTAKSCDGTHLIPLKKKKENEKDAFQIFL